MDEGTVVVVEVNGKQEYGTIIMNKGRDVWVLLENTFIVIVPIHSVYKEQT